MKKLIIRPNIHNHHHDYVVEIMKCKLCKKSAEAYPSGYCNPCWDKGNVDERFVGVMTRRHCPCCRQEDGIMFGGDKCQGI